MEEYNSVGTTIYNLRKKNKMSQEDLANNLFVTRTTVSKWERGINLPSIDSIKEMSIIFRTSTDVIIFGTEKKNFFDEK